MRLWGIVAVCLLACIPALSVADPMTIGVWAANTAYAAGITSIAVVNVIGAMAYMATVVAVSAGLAEISKQLSPTPKMLRGVTQEFGGTVESRRIIYGEVRISGMNAIPPVVSGSGGDYLHQILVLAGHPVSDITDVYFNQVLIEDANIGAVTGTDADGVVGGGGTFDDLAWIRRYDGSQTTVDYILDQSLGSSWTSTDKGQGLAYLALRFEYKKKVYGPIGKPEVSAIVHGMKVYDPREDSTNGGSGAQRYTDSTTWTYSNNPALCLAHYLMSSLGMEEDPTRIDWLTVAVAANECDEVVTIPTGSIPASTTQSRYTCNIVLDATDRFEDNIEAICDCMMGHCYYTGGKWQIYAGTWSASAFSLSENDVVGGVHIQTEAPRNQKYNAVRGQYFDPSRQFQPSEFQPRTDSTYETEDGERIWREVMLRGCTNEYEAQRAAIIILRRSRNTTTVTADFGLSAFKVRPFETGTLTLPEIGWTNQPVRCNSWEFRPEGTVRLTLTEEASANWDDPDLADYAAVVISESPVTADYVPPDITSLTITPVSTGVLLSWESPEVAPGTYYEIIRQDEATGSTLGSPEPVLATTYGSTYLDPVNDGAIYYYWVRPVSAAGTVGNVYPVGAGETGYRVFESVIPDPHFERSGTLGDYWTLYEATAGAITDFNASLSSTGGVAGGKVSITFPTTAEGLILIPVKNPKLQAVTGDYFEVTVRWRRTSALASGEDASMFVMAYLVPDIGSDYYPTSVPLGNEAEVVYGNAINLSTYAGLYADTTGDDLSAPNVNEWEETKWIIRAVNYPKNQTQSPYFFIGLKFETAANASNAGTIEIDTFDVKKAIGGESILQI